MAVGTRYEAFKLNAALVCRTCRAVAVCPPPPGPRGGGCGLRAIATLPAAMLDSMSEASGSSAGTSCASPVETCAASSVFAVNIRSP